MVDDLRALAHREAYSEPVMAARLRRLSGTWRRLVSGDGGDGCRAIDALVWCYEEHGREAAIAAALKSQPSRCAAPATDAALLILRGLA